MKKVFTNLVPSLQNSYSTPFQLITSSHFKTGDVELSGRAFAYIKQGHEFNYQQCKKRKRKFLLQIQ